MTAIRSHQKFRKPNPRIASRIFLILMGCLPITVSAQQQTPALPPTKPLTVALESNRTTALPNEQILVTRTVVSHQDAFNITGQDPDLANADFLSVYEQSEKLPSGQSQRITRWAAFATTAGKLMIPAIQFQATLPAIGGSNQQANAISQALTIRINPSARATKSDWLPAADMRLDLSQWVSTDVAWRAGEPRTLSLTVVVSGQRAAAIKPLVFSNTDNLRFYTEPAQLTDTIGPDGITGTRRETVVVVPSRAGTLEMPGQTIHWFNTRTRRDDTVQLPTVTLPVAPPTITTHVSSEPPEQWIAWLLVTLLGLGATGLWIQNRALRQQSTSPSNSDGDQFRERATSERQAWRVVVKTLANGQTEQARAAIIRWAQIRWVRAADGTPIGRLEQVAALTDQDALRSSLHHLDQALYSTEDLAGPDLRQLASRLAGQRREFSARWFRQPWGLRATQATRKQPGLPSHEPLDASVQERSIDTLQPLYPDHSKTPDQARRM